MLEQAGIKLKGLNVDKLRAEYQALETQKKELTTTYKSCEKEVWNLKRKQENLNRYLLRTHLAHCRFRSRLSQPSHRPRISHRNLVLIPLDRKSVV